MFDKLFGNRAAEKEMPKASAAPAARPAGKPAAMTVRIDEPARYQVLYEYTYRLLGNGCYDHHDAIIINGASAPGEWSYERSEANYIRKVWANLEDYIVYPDEIVADKRGGYDREHWVEKMREILEDEKHPAYIIRRIDGTLSLITEPLNVYLPVPYGKGIDQHQEVMFMADVEHSKQHGAQRRALRHTHLLRRVD